MHEKGDKRKEALTGKPQVRIGRYGVTDGLIEEVKKRLRKDKVVKVKVLKSFLRSGIKMEEVAEEVASRTRSEIIDLRGHTFTLAKPFKGEEFRKRA